MLDRDGRAEAAQFLQKHSAVVAAHGGVAGDDVARVRELADALEAEPAGYDYETAAAERGEALAALVAAFDRDIGEVLAPLDSVERHRIADDCMRTTYAALSRAEEIMEGVERTHALVPVVVAEATALRYRILAREAEAVGHDDLAREYRRWENDWHAAARGERVEWPS